MSKINKKVATLLLAAITLTSASAYAIDCDTWWFLCKGNPACSCKVN